MRTIFTCLTTAVLMFTPALADTPSINITAPTGTIYVSSFPYQSAIVMSITHNSLNDITHLTLSANGVDVVNDIGKPFQQTGQADTPVCGQPLLEKGGSCSVSSSSQGTVTIPWLVPAPGTYNVIVSIKHTNDVQEDSETVVFSLVAVEYPAPPAIANAYINGTPALKAAAPKLRGCVINKIAEQHGKFHKYNDPPGPYNNALVQADVRTFWGGCGGTWPLQ